MIPVNNKKKQIVPFIPQKYTKITDKKNITIFEEKINIPIKKIKEKKNLGENIAKNISNNLEENFAKNNVDNLEENFAKNNVDNLGEDAAKNNADNLGEEGKRVKMTDEEMLKRKNLIIK